MVLGLLHLGCAPGAFELKCPENSSNQAQKPRTVQILTIDNHFYPPLPYILVTEGVMQEYYLHLTRPSLDLDRRLDPLSVAHKERSCYGWPGNQ